LQDILPSFRNVTSVTYQLLLSEDGEFDAKRIGSYSHANGHGQNNVTSRDAAVKLQHAGVVNHDLLGVKVGIFTFRILFFDNLVL
jgi:hypothetical protein